MAWELRDPDFRSALDEVVERMNGDLALAGVVGVQLHVAASFGLEQGGVSARRIEVVAFRGAEVPATARGVPVTAVRTLGFDRTIEGGRRELSLGGARYPVAAPEHILGTMLAAPELGMAAKWAAFALMRVYEGRLDLEEVRGFVKRCDDPERETLLHELAYLAA